MARAIKVVGLVSAYAHKSHGYGEYLAGAGRPLDQGQLVGQRLSHGLELAFVQPRIEGRPGLQHRPAVGRVTGRERVAPILPPAGRELLRRRGLDVASLEE